MIRARITRRTLLGAGAALTAMGGTAAFGSNGPSAGGRGDAPSIDALLIDETIGMPGSMTAFIEASRRSLPVIGIRLDAAGHGGLLGVLERSRVIAGISSGATLFCLERIAWDRGFRLTRRSERGAADLGEDCSPREVAAFLGGAHDPDARPLPLACAYRASRVDGTLHAWAMRQCAGSRP